jgi:ribosomal protein L29
MKTKIKNELNELDEAALNKKAEELTEKISGLVYERHVSSNKNTRQVKNLKKEKAVILTILREREKHGKK